jgi:hypothetical protein
MRSSPRRIPPHQFSIAFTQLNRFETGASPSNPTICPFIPLFFSMQIEHRRPEPEHHSHRIASDFGAVTSRQSNSPLPSQLLLAFLPAFPESESKQSALRLKV